MVIGIPKEVKNREHRVGLIPSGVRALMAHGHKVLVEAGAGIGSGISDAAYTEAGAKVVPTAADAWNADMVIKVKEPLPQEYGFLRPNLVLFTYLHLAAERQLTEALLEHKVTGIAYETIQENRALPLLRPMSEVAGRMAVQVGAYYLQSSWDEPGTGKGILLGGVPGVHPGRVVILGGGVAGANAAKVALGMGAIVRIIDIDTARLDYLESTLGGRLITLSSTYDNIYESVLKSDLVIGTVLVAGAKAPKLVTREMISKMQKRSVVVDVSVDQGGCVETCRPTSHENPTYLVDDVLHYCVTNMPGAVARTSTFSLTNATIRYALNIADSGAEAAAEKSDAIRKGFNTYQGKLVHQQISEAHGIEYTPLSL
ncbi:MAG: alanine dehydrogenase [Bdellovibrionales bacterium]|nr:alanine dehydrogenase [Bdellovibrionales bacterium]